MEEFNIGESLETFLPLAIPYLLKIVLAILTLIIGMSIIKRLIKFLRTRLEKRNADPSLIPFLSGILRATLIVMLIITVASMVGIATTSFVAVLGAAGLAIGLALQGSLANFAGGVMILIMKPFKVGEVIEAQGVIASVSEIQIFHTVLKSYDNKTIIIPNGPLYNDKIINYSTEATRVVEWIFGISYDDNIDQARQIIDEIVYTDDRVIDKESKYINVAELADSSVNLKVRARVNQPDFWSLFFDVTEKVKKAFDQQGITIPYPQVDAHLHQKTP
uniref:Mechanosensitive ion channel n=1 Tax=Roseihalotalea indica TaxID=2867963 RepID=A0AA49JF26_9BACT|nr:mechanosensitive ion channel [Tunicatimonas sp. TK19036]